MIEHIPVPQIAYHKHCQLIPFGSKYNIIIIDYTDNVENLY